MTLELSPRMASAEAAGTADGIYHGARLAEEAIYSKARSEAIHAQLQAAGVCGCAGITNAVNDMLGRMKAASGAPFDLDPDAAAGFAAAADMAGQLSDDIAAAEEKEPAKATGGVITGQPYLAGEPVTTTLDYCGKCGRAKVFGVLNHAPNCPENPQLPARKPAWAQVATRDVPEAVEG